MGTGRVTGRLSTVARPGFMSCTVAPCHRQPRSGMPWASVNRLRLTGLTLGRWDWARFFSPPGALWSAPRPCSASSSQALQFVVASSPVRHSLGIPRRPPIPGSANERCPAGANAPWRPELSTGSRYAARRICRWPQVRSGLRVSPAAWPRGWVFHPLGNQRGQHRPHARSIPGSRWWGWPNVAGPARFVAVASSPALVSIPPV